VDCSLFQVLQQCTSLQFLMVLLCVKIKYMFFLVPAKICGTLPLRCGGVYGVVPPALVAQLKSGGGVVLVVKL